jgi:hypothetical protein
MSFLVNVILPKGIVLNFSGECIIVESHCAESCSAEYLLVNVIMLKVMVLNIILLDVIKGHSHCA